MKSLYFFGYYLNGLEFVTYVIIPLAMFLMILLYIASNYKLIKLLFESNDKVLNKLNVTCDLKQNNIKAENNILEKQIGIFNEKEEILKEKV